MYLIKSENDKIKRHILEPGQDYIKVIEEHSKKGWRLKQIFSPPGTINFHVLVFEKMESKK